MQKTIHIVVLAVLAATGAGGEWQQHEVRLVNGQQPDIVIPAKVQVVSESWNRVVAVPYIVYMLEKDRVLMLVGCDYPHHPEVLYSDDHGATWSSPARVVSKTDGKPVEGLGTSLTYLGGGKVMFLTGQRWLSEDFGATWEQLSVVEPTSDGRQWYMWDPLFIEWDTIGRIKRLVETGYTVLNPPEVEKTQSQGHLRYSEDLGKTWSASVKVHEWKGVNEVAMLRAKNYNIVAACRTDIPPSKSGEWIDHYEGLAVSVSRDNGETWSYLSKLYDYGRHHPSLVLLPDGRILMTYVVRKGYVDAPDSYPQFGIEAIISADNGSTWDLDHRYILNSWKGNRLGENKWWPSSQSTSTVMLPGGSLLTAYGTGYRSQPDANGANPSPRDAAVVLWRLSDAALDGSTAMRDAAQDSDARNVVDPAPKK